MMQEFSTKHGDAKWERKEGSNIVEVRYILKEGINHSEISFDDMLPAGFDRNKAIHSTVEEWTVFDKTTKQGLIFKIAVM
jgi:hypothetical protein